MTNSLEHQAGVFNYVNHFFSLCDKTPGETISKVIGSLWFLVPEVVVNDCLPMERQNFTAEGTWWSKASHLREGWGSSVLT